MWPVTLTYFCYGWTLWLYLNWLPLFFKTNYDMDISKSAIFAAGVFFAGVVGDTLGGVLSDYLLQRTGNLRLARMGLIVCGFVGALPVAAAHPVRARPDHRRPVPVGRLLLRRTGGRADVGGADGHRAAHAGTAAGLMNIGSALAAIVSPIVAGYMIDVTGNWYLPFLVSMGVLAVGAVTAFLMHPEKPFEEAGAAPPAEAPGGTPVTAG